MDKILLTGKTSLFPVEALRYIGESYSVLLTGRKAGSGSASLPESVRVFPTDPSDSDFSRVFELGQIRAVWHVTGCADGGRPADETAQLETILRLCAQARADRLIVLTESTDLTDYRSLINRWSGDQNTAGTVDLAVVRLPLLTGTNRGRLERIFSAMRQNREIRLDSSGVRQISVLPVQELTALLLRMSGETWFHPGIYAADGMDGSLESLQEILQSLRPGTQILLEGESVDRSPRERQQSGRRILRCRIPVTGREMCDGQLGVMYRLPVSNNWHSEIAALYAKSQEGLNRESSGRELLSAFFRRFGRIAGPVLDMVVMFLIAEALSRITSESVYFKIVDVRLLYVILMGMMHGLAVGSAAAILECVMLVIRYSEIGISGLLLFYNVENWIPFVYYLTAGVISGYSHQKKEQEIRSVTAENDLIRSKYLFLNEAYRTSVSERGALRSQILGEEESYARVYGAVRKMAQRTPEAVCVEAVRVLRELLENETVSIYQLSGGEKTAELLSCCLENASRLSIDLESCPEMMSAVGEGTVWKNTRFLEEMPMYASLVRYSRTIHGSQDGPREMSLLVTVEQAKQDQLSNWYVNHFEILCGLFQEALENASLRERILS